MSRALPLFTLTVVALSSLASGCAHTVRIDSAPGADIYVNGQHVGTAPVMYNETTGLKEEVRVTARKGNVENTIVVSKSNTDTNALLAGTGAGVGACCGIMTAASVLAVVLTPCAVVGALALPAIASGALSGFVYGNKLPDNVTVPLVSPYRHTALVDARRPEAMY
jgi:hypothetical protein